jgi:hypothetical protein
VRTTLSKHMEMVATACSTSPSSQLWLPVAALELGRLRSPNGGPAGLRKPGAGPREPLITDGIAAVGQLEPAAHAHARDAATRVVVDWCRGAGRRPTRPSRAAWR